MSRPRTAGRLGLRPQLAGPSRLNQLPNTTQGYMVGDCISTAFVRASGDDAALSLFAAGKPVTGDTCMLGDVTSCVVPMEAPSGALKAAATQPATRSTEAAPILATHSDHAASAALSYR